LRDAGLRLARLEALCVFVVRIEPQCRVAVGQRLLALASFQMQLCSMDVHIRQMRAEANRPVQIAQRPVQLSFLTIDQGPLHQGGIVPRIKTQRPGQVRQRLTPLAALGMDRAALAPGCRQLVVQPQCLAEIRQRLVELSCLALDSAALVIGVRTVAITPHHREQRRTVGQGLVVFTEVAVAADALAISVEKIRPMVQGGGAFSNCMASVLLLGLFRAGEKPVVQGSACGVLTITIGEQLVEFRVQAAQGDGLKEEALGRDGEELGPVTGRRKDRAERGRS